MTGGVKMKKDKKDENRFTIRLNPLCPRQQWAKGVLLRAGRCKSSLIADALYVLLNGNANGELPIINQSVIHTNEATAHTTTTVNFNSVNIDEKSIDEHMDDDMLDGLNAFFQ